MPKNEKEIRILIEPMPKGSYWLTRLIDGIRTYALKKRIKLGQYSSDTLAEHGITMIIGMSDSWLISQAREFALVGETLLIVNACIPPELEGYHSVCFALERSVRDTVYYLASLGCKRPALVGLHRSSSADRLKHRRFTEECERLGIEPICPSTESSGLAEQLDELTSSLGSLSPDALFCANDTAAILMRSRLHRSGLDPKLPLVGMGNSYLGRKLSPPLTTVDFDYFTLGYEAARVYMLAAELPPTSPTVLSASIPSRLIIRDGIGNPEFIGGAARNPNPYMRGALESDYFAAPEVDGIIKLEDYLQVCDRIDRELIFNSANQYSQLAEQLYISERTLKYRMSKILTALGLDSKSDLERSVRSIISPRD